MRLIWAITLVFMAATPGARAQDDQTLADIRQELSILYVEVQRLKRELSTTGGAGTQVVGATVLDRVAVIESELQRLTSKSEELEHRINRVVGDGTNRIEDLEFRLCDLDADCDISTLEFGKTLGGGELPAATGDGTPAPDGSAGVELAIGEQADFDSAKSALDAGDPSAAAAQFASFLQTYPNGPLTAEAYFLRGAALEESGAIRDAARSYLDSFSTAPNGPMAPDALYKVGTTLGALGQTEEACQMLDQVGVRFPASEATADAQTAKQTIGCL